MNYKTIAIAFAVLSLPMLSHAHSNPDEVKVCYSFSGNTLKQIQPCIVSTGGGAGGIYESIRIGNKSYLFEGGCIINGDGDCDYDYAYYPGDPNGKEKPRDAISYLRDATFHHRVSEDESSLANHLLYCFKTKNGSVDICTN